MGAFTSVTPVGRASNLEGRKVLIVTAVGPASYDAGGSEIDLGTTALGLLDGFTAASGATCIKVAGTAADKYFATAIAGASAHTLKIVVRDAEAGTAAAEVSGDISALTFTLVCYGT